MTPREKFVAALDRYCEARTRGGTIRSLKQRDAVLAAYDEAARPVAADTLCRQLQKRCVDWDVYWRAPDAHGVQLTIEQATELLEDALGVEVEIAASPAPAGEADAWRYRRTDNGDTFVSQGRWPQPLGVWSETPLYALSAARGEGAG